MKKRNTYQTRRVFFKQWTRNSWAVFASLQVVVHNCCTNIASFKDSLLKQQGANRSEMLSLSVDVDSLMESQSDDIGVPWEEELILEYSLPKTMPTTITRGREVATLLSDNHISLSAKSKTLVGIFYTQR